MKMEMNLQDKKLELIQWLSSLEDNALVEKIMDLRRKENKDWWDSLSKTEKASLEIGIREADSGCLNTHEEVKKRYEKWL